MPRSSAATDLAAAWPQVLDQLHAVDHERAVRMWLRNPKVRPVAVEDGVLWLECPTVLYVATIAERYADAIRTAFAAVTGSEFEAVRCRVPGSALRTHERAVARAGGGTAAAAAPAPAATRPGAGGKLLADFVVGSCNRLAYDAVTRLVDEPRSAVNPVFIHGASGLGKTHLELGLANAFRERYPKSKVVYIRCEQFANDFIEACSQAGTAALSAFRVRMRHPDLLLIDDIHFLSKGIKEKTKDELFATFDHLSAQGKKVVITSDAGPRDIKYLEDRFLGRFSGGLVVPLERPDPQVRRLVLVQKAKAQGVDLPDEVVEFVAAHVTNNIRLLEGAVNKLVQYGQSFRCRIDLAAARQALADLVGRAADEDPASMVRREVAVHFGMTAQDLTGRGRSAPKVAARHVAIYVLRHVTGDTYAACGSAFGLKDHSSAAHACAQVTRQRHQDPALDRFVADLIERARR